MCNLSASSSHHPASQRHLSGTTAAPKRHRSATSALPQRTNTNTIRYLCVPNCGIFSGAGTGCPRLCPMFARQIAPTWPLSQVNIVILATWMMCSFFAPNLYFSLPFSPSGPGWQPFSFPDLTWERLEPGINSREGRCRHVVVRRR
jgi:hypothetical protein